MERFGKGAPSRALTLRVSRSVEIYNNQGARRDLALHKSKALLGILALSPNHQTSTTAVINILWPGRSGSQANDSLRQCRADIRRAFAPHHQALSSAGKVEKLDPELVQVSLADRELLADLSVPNSPGFLDWVKQQAQQPRADEIPALSVSILARGSALGHSASIAGDLFAATVRDLGGGAVTDLRAPLSNGERGTTAQANGPQPGVVLVVDGRQDGARLTLMTMPQGTVVDALDIPDDVEEPVLYARANRLAFVACDWLAQSSPDQSDRQAARLCSAGMNALFGLAAHSEKAAVQYFEDAYEAAPNGLFLAWQAYASTFAIAERRADCAMTERDRAQALARRAREMAPWNSYVLALTAHVETICRRSYLSAYELAQRSLDLNRSNPIAWGTLGVAQCHLGEVEDGLRHTKWASSIGQHAPYRYQLDAWTCVAATIARDFPAARAAAERSHAMNENFAPPLRYLSALLLNEGLPQEAMDAVEKLAKVEPTFQFSDLKDRDYPAAGLHRSGLSAKMPDKI